VNIFVLHDTDLDQCARWHMDVHCTKMILETTQLLNNALISNDASYIPFYKPTHQKHPSSIWTSASVANFDWLNKLGLALCREYTYRYGKTHKCQQYLEAFTKSEYRTQLPPLLQIPFVKCMPDEYKVESAVESYRNYYRGAKQHLAKWTKREQPEWWFLKTS